MFVSITTEIVKYVLKNVCLNELIKYAFVLNLIVSHTE